MPWPEDDSEPEPAVAPELSDFFDLLELLELLCDLPLALWLPEEPELAPEALDDGLGVFGGIEVDVPLPPAMPASLPVVAPDDPVAFCERTVDEGEVEELLPAPLVCANASDDIDAITTNDRVLSLVVNVIATSF